MSLLTTSAASMHQLGAAAAFAASSQDLVTNGKGQTIRNWWCTHEMIANAITAGGWIIEQHTIRKNPNLDRVTNDAVRTKDMCVVGATVTNIANIIVALMAKRGFPEGVPVTGSGQLSPHAPASALKYQRYFRLMGMLNRAFVAGAIGFTPFVNFDILKSYRPGAIYRLFT